MADFIFCLALGVVLGGRLGYVLFYDFSSYLSHPLRIFAIWRGRCHSMAACWGLRSQDSGIPAVFSCLICSWLIWLPLQRRSGLGWAGSETLSMENWHGRPYCTLGNDLRWRTVAPASIWCMALLEGVVLLLSCPFLARRFQAPGTAIAAFLGDMVCSGLLWNCFDSRIVNWGCTGDFLNGAAVESAAFLAGGILLVWLNWKKKPKDVTV